LGQCIHFDACILEGGLNRRDPRHQECRTAYSQALNQNRRHSFSLKISQVALGEIFNDCCRDSNYELLEEIFKRVIDWDKPSITQEALKTAAELTTKDNRLKINDALIVAIAIHDENCTWLLTTDTKIIGNNVIDKKIKKVREGGQTLSISSHIGN